MTKTKKNLRPQQVAPVQRETTTNSLGEKGVQPSVILFAGNPFAGDDTE